MSNQCPYCGSLRNVCVSPVSLKYVCLACEKFFIKGEQPKQTVFDTITASLEVLAPKFVYFDYSVCDDNGMGYPWCSTLFEDGGHFETEEKAIAATIEKLKEEKNG